MPKASARSAAVVRRAKTVVRPSQTRTNRPPQPGCDGSSREDCRTVGDRRAVAHLQRALQVRREEITERAAPGDVRRDECGVAPLTGLVAAGEPAAIRRVRFDHPQRRVRTLDGCERVDAPHLVRAADEIHAQLRQDVGSIVQRLRQVVDTAPHEHPQRPRIDPPRAAHDPVRAFGRASRAGRTGFDCTLFADSPQGVGRRIAGGIRLQVREVRGVAIDDLQEMLLAAGPVRRRDQPLDVEHVGVDEEVHHRLEIVGIGAADVRRNEDPRPRIRRLLPRRGRNHVRDQKRQEDEAERRHGWQRVILVLCEGLCRRTPTRAFAWLSRRCQRLRGRILKRAVRRHLRYSPAMSWMSRTASGPGRD